MHSTIFALASAPGLIDEYLLSIHPAVITDGPQLFEALPSSLALSLVDSRVFPSGCVILRYRTGVADQAPPADL